MQAPQGDDEALEHELNGEIDTPYHVFVSMKRTPPRSSAQNDGIAATILAINYFRTERGGNYPVKRDMNPTSLENCWYIYWYKFFPN
jgi:hypothetical protein